MKPVYRGATEDCPSQNPAPKPSLDFGKIGHNIIMYRSKGHHVCPEAIRTYENRACADHAGGRQLCIPLKEQTMDKEPMWFFDDPPEDYRNFREKAISLEREYLELRTILRDAEKALRGEPENEYNQAKVRYLKKRLKDLEEQAPWLVSGLMIEYGLWGGPH
jgi:hypothetical protein